MVRTQYRVINVGSGEALTDWVDTLGLANHEADECEKHESQPECRVESREIDETEYQIERIKSAYRAAGLAVGWGGISVYPSLRLTISPPGPSHWLVVDHRPGMVYHEPRMYETADAAIADAANWKAAERLSEFF